MKVLLVHNEYARPSGEERALHGIIDLLIGRGNSVVPFISSSERIPQSFVKQVGAFFSGIYSFSARRHVSGILASERPELAQLQNLYPLLSPSVLLACRDHRVPVVMRCPNYRLFCPTGLFLSNGHICEKCLGGGELWCILKNCTGSLPKSIGYALRNAFARVTGMIRRNVTVFVVLSEFQRKRFTDAGIEPGRIEVLPNMAPAPAKEAAAGDGEGGFVSFVGRISQEKGIGDFLAAARALPEQRFAVAGDASGMPEVAAHAPPNVAFCGFLSGAKLAEFYRETRILACCSTWFEGFPNVIAEAMAAGRPVVATRIGSLPEIVDDGVTGLLYEPGNAGELVDKVRRLLADPELCREMGAAGRRKVMAEYSRDRCYERLMRVYQKALDLGAGNTT